MKRMPEVTALGRRIKGNGPRLLKIVTIGDDSSRTIVLRETTAKAAGK